ncbi:hypothetical protein SY89_02499 [Halolamina pelagica]|uniref:Ribonuclease J beta-CASP domain-containing protein n=1 Tax=Halolamina pelagica TaxID=699431 RepID=A0A0P7HXC7_9EURY|nr:hypothetical protein SY89_02499 [Halolamina pelagica]
MVYGLDKRMDHTPVIGDPIDMDRFREISREEGVLAYIEDCTNASKKGRTPSERVAREHLRDVMMSLEDYDGGIVATTFSSHIARVKSLVEFAEEIGREPVLLGRSMEKYSGTAERLGFVDFPDDLGMYGHRKSVDRTFKRIMKEGKENYLPIVTGHQGEPRAMLTRMGRGETPTTSRTATRSSSAPGSSRSRPTRASATSPSSCSGCRARTSTTTSTFRAT